MHPATGPNSNHVHLCPFDRVVWFIDGFRWCRLVHAPLTRETHLFYPKDTCLSHFTQLPSNWQFRLVVWRLGNGFPCTHKNQGLNPQTTNANHQFTQNGERALKGYTDGHFEYDNICELIGKKAKVNQMMVWTYLLRNSAYLESPAPPPPFFAWDHHGVCETLQLGPRIQVTDLHCRTPNCLVAFRLLGFPSCYLSASNTRALRRFNSSQRVTQSQARGTIRWPATRGLVEMRGSHSTQMPGVHGRQLNRAQVCCMSASLAMVMQCLTEGAVNPGLLTSKSSMCRRPCSLVCRNNSNIGDDHRSTS